jgi:hypothetical protein
VYLLAFCKGSVEFFIMVSCKHLLGLYVYQSQNRSWQTYSNKGYLWMDVDFVVFNNIIYVLMVSKGNPHNVHENSVMGNEAMIGPRHGKRARKPHSMWKEFVKK